ncbi:hypothetical protein [Taklimakanibacter deserti]|uniref:hypothetical protein n=1 Tax=Taklimakanibacter deserti TaxID=2267839 RepID=UPI0034D6B57B
MPLELMLKIMRDETADLQTRMDMAKAAAPYFHPKLSSIEYRAPDYDLTKLTDDELKEFARLVQLALS